MKFLEKFLNKKNYKDVESLKPGDKHYKAYLGSFIKSLDEELLSKGNGVYKSLYGTRFKDSNQIISQIETRL